MEDVLCIAGRRWAFGSSPNTPNFVIASLREGVCMRVAVRTTGMVILALVCAVLLALTSTTTSAVTLAATTALIMGGSGHPLSTLPDSIWFVQQYMGTAVYNFISPSSTATTPATGIPKGPYIKVAVITPEQFSPNGHLTFDQSVTAGKANLDKCIHSNGCAYNPDVGSTGPASTDTFAVFGNSQSATIATLEKRTLADQYPGGQGPSVSFVLIANGNRPNGGLLARGPQGLTIPIPLPFGGATFSGPTPTNTQYPTVDIAQQYDGWADFPENPLDLLADVNANLGIQYLHPTYGNSSLSDPGIVTQGRYGDTTYYMIPTPILPVLMPLQQLPLVGSPVADTLDPPLRVVVEAGYDRTISPGQPTPWNLLYFPHPIGFAVDSVVAIPTGLDNGLQDILGIRPFGTQRPGPYGVGGPAVTYLNPPATRATMQPTAPTIPTLFRPNAGLAASAGGVMTDFAKSVVTEFAKFGRLTSVLSGVPASIPSPLNTPAGQPSLTNPTGVVPGLGVAARQSSNPLGIGEPAGRPNTAPSPLASAKVATPSLPVVTKPSQPRLGLPIGSNAPSVKATPPSANGPLSKVLVRLMGGQNATSSNPSGSASSHPAAN